ncbi:hypothetical protein M8818_005902 [Zalaria obscura]|uniref:Uncharacterized protein n=1 Tax=Zalaria obscura TaxID=2024903 RepID=A0ACC3S6D8_9PEZI
MDYSDPDWPPGTVKLQALHSGEKNVEAEIILQPRPTDNPNGRPVGEVAATQRAEVMEKSEQLSKEPAAHPSDIESPADPDHMARRSLSVAHVNANLPRKTYWQKLALFETSPGPWSHFLRHSWQPFALLFLIPGILFCSLCYAILLAWSTVMTTALSTYMLDPPYNFTASQIGLMSLAPFIGSTLGSLVVGPASDYVILQLAKRNNGIYEPEMRFWVFLPFIPFQLAGTWWFAFALSEGKPWSQVAVAYALAQFGSAPMQSIALTYMLDAYNDVVADALTALTFARNLFSTIFVFAMPAWIAAVGIPNVFNTIGAIGIAIFSFSGIFIWRGKHFRYKTAKVYRFYAERQFSARPL